MLISISWFSEGLEKTHDQIYFLKADFYISACMTCLKRLCLYSKSHLHSEGRNGGQTLSGPRCLPDQEHWCIQPTDTDTDMLVRPWWNALVSSDAADKVRILYLQQPVHPPGPGSWQWQRWSWSSQPWGDAVPLCERHCWHCSQELRQNATEINNVIYSISFIVQQEIMLDVDF